MTHYFVDNRTQPDGAHEVHAVGCKRMAPDKQYLGDFMTCEQAVFEARQVYWHIGGCARCMEELTASETAAAMAFGTTGSLSVPADASVAKHRAAASDAVDRWRKTRFMLISPLLRRRTTV